MLINLVLKWRPGIWGELGIKGVRGVVNASYIHYYFAIAPIRAGIIVVANKENIPPPTWSLDNICLFLKRDVLGFDRVLISFGDVVNFFLIRLNFFLSNLKVFLSIFWQLSQILWIHSSDNKGMNELLLFLGMFFNGSKYLSDFSMYTRFRSPITLDR